jgi:dihydrofolate synthase / folylpolyglutamate synthase
MTYREAVARITGLRGGEMAGMRPGLERIEALLEAVGSPERAMTLVQVAGTNGKGSVSAMLAAILTSAGRRVGLFTSPHLVDLRERIRVGGAPIPEADVVDGMEALGSLVARLDATMFEALTALALDHFARESVEVAVLETGLGGRLDSTSVGRPAVEVITRIDLDHEAYLGSTLDAIAREKAAIIRSGIALSARQEPDVEAELARRAFERGVPLLVEGRDLAVRVRRATLDGQWLDFEGPGWGLDDVRCALLGVFQPGNAVLAAAAARALGAEDAAIRDGLASVRWPGRFQLIRRDPPVIVDGAHNPAGAQALAASLAAYFPGRRGTLVVGISADKDKAGILRALVPLAHRVICTAADHPRAASPESLAGLARLAAGDASVRIETAPSPPEALRLALAEPDTPMVCVAGSLFMIGEILAQATENTDIFSQSPVRG